MRRVRWIFGVVAVVMVACGGGGATGETSSTSGVETGAVTTSGAPTTSGAATGGAATTSGTATTSGGSTSGGSTSSTGGGPVDVACDVVAQDCPAGEKCAPYSRDGGSWDATRCVPVTGDGQPGDPCTAPEGGMSGLDDCAKGVFCWDVDPEYKGSCVEMCSGVGDLCGVETQSCFVAVEHVLQICYPDCDPLALSCPDGDRCIFTSGGFFCVLGTQFKGVLFEDCFIPQGCKQGLMCASPSWAVECHPQLDGCCLPYCDLEDPAFVCPGAGQSCVSVYEPGMAPPKFAHIGVCRIPE